MDLRVFEHMKEPELRNYLEFLLWQYRIVDAFWFLYVAERFDQPSAERVNERVWAKVPQMGAKDLLKRFNIEEKGLKGFVKALKLFPWTILTGYDIEEKPDEVIITIPHCVVQEARARHGLDEFVCKHMHKGEFVNFAGEVDPDINVECIFAPPDPHPKEMFCKWRFTLRGGQK